MKPYYTFTVCLLVSVMLVFAVGCSNNEKSMVNAVKDGNIVKVQGLLDKGVDPNLKTDDGKTILMLSVYLGHSDISALLIEKGADVNLQDNDGKTALMIAAENGDIEMAKLLLENGADIGATDINGKTALQLAQEKNQNAMVDFLKKWNQTNKTPTQATIPTETPGSTNETSDGSSISSPDETSAEKPSQIPASKGEDSGMSVSKELNGEEMNDSDASFSGDPGREESDNCQLSSIYFDFDKALLQSDQTETMAENLEILMNNSNMYIMIGGHTDEQGAKAYNQALSLRRAKAIRKYLISNGIKPGRIVIYGFGEEYPLEKGHNEESWELNRRADIFLWDRKLSKNEVIAKTLNQ